MTIQGRGYLQTNPNYSFHAENERLPRKRPMKEPVVLSWSGGKDSTMAAYHLIASQRYEIVALLTTVTEEFDRISMHGVRRDLLEQQADSLGIPLRKIMIPKDCPNEVYEARMREALSHFKAQGITKIAFGDLFLQDVKQYRDERLAQVDMTGLYPIWMRFHADVSRASLVNINMDQGRLAASTELSAANSHSLTSLRLCGSP